MARPIELLQSQRTSACDRPTPVGWLAALQQNDVSHQVQEPAALLPALLPRLWRFSLRLTQNHHDAEDLLQRSCVRALERWEQLQPGTSALSWLFSITHSVWLNEVRARAIRARCAAPWKDELSETVADVNAPHPAETVLHQQVIDAVGQLPDAQRAVMLLVAVEGLSYREAAKVLGVPIGTVMSRLARARLSIGQCFRDGATCPDLATGQARALARSA